MSKKSNGETSGWAGWVAFAGFLGVLLGTFHAIAGLVALFKDEVYVQGQNNLWVLDYTRWGWIHLFMGIFVATAGFAILSGKTWGRIVGVVLTSVSALANFAFIPVYPVWSLVLIIIDVFIIYALIVHGDALKIEE